MKALPDQQGFFVLEKNDKDTKISCEKLIQETVLMQLVVLDLKKVFLLQV
jgi:hypothetical protein